MKGQFHLQKLPLQFIFKLKESSAKMLTWATWCHHQWTSVTHSPHIPVYFTDRGVFQSCHITISVSTHCRQAFVLLDVLFVMIAFFRVRCFIFFHPVILPSEQNYKWISLRGQWQIYPADSIIPPLIYKCTSWFILPTPKLCLVLFCGLSWQWVKSLRRFKIKSVIM